MWILHNSNNIWYPCLTIDVKVLRFLSGGLISEKSTVVSYMTEVILH